MDQSQNAKADLICCQGHKHFRTYGHWRNEQVESKSLGSIRWILARKKTQQIHEIKHHLFLQKEP